MRFMADNKHYRAAKIDGFWDFVTRDPGDYRGRHRLGDAACPLWAGCALCMAEVSS